MQSLVRLSLACSVGQLAVTRMFTDISLPWLKRSLELRESAPPNAPVATDDRGRLCPTHAQLFAAMQTVIVE
jgi:hypothetical protein